MSLDFSPLPPAPLFGYYPGTVAVITVATATRRNAMSAGWHTALSSAPPLYGVAVGPARHTHALLHEAGTFAINFLPRARADLIRAFGNSSGREGDKLARPDLALLPGRLVPAPVLADAYLAYECRLAAVHPVGDHDLFVGEVLGIHHAPAAYDEHRVLRPEVADPAVYLGRGAFARLAFG